MSTPIIEAAKTGNVEEIRRLISSGSADVNAVDGRGMSALHHAISQGKDKAAIELLQTPGINVSLVSHDGKTILIRATEKNMKTVVGHLVEHFLAKLNCTAIDMNGESALFYAIDQYMYSFPIIQMLAMNCGRELLSTKTVNVRTGKPRNPIQYARFISIEETKELKRLDNIIAKKRERGEEPSVSDLGMQRGQKMKLYKIVEIISYLESLAGAGAGAGSGIAAPASGVKPRRGGSRSNLSSRRTTRRRQMIRKNKNTHKKTKHVRSISSRKYTI